MTMEMGLIVFVVAVVVVLATSLLKTVNMTEKAKAAVATVLSVIGGALTVVGTNGWDFSGFDGGDVLGTVLLVYGAAQLIYNFILKGTQVDAKLEQTGVTGGDA